MSDNKSSELRRKIAQLKDEISMIKKQDVDKELRKEMLEERKGQIRKAEKTIKELAEIERKEIQEKMISELARRLKPEIMKAACLYHIVHYKELASFLECSSKHILDIVDYLRASKELFATVEYPNIIFERGDKSSESHTAKKRVQPAPSQQMPPCLKCNKATRFIAQYERYYCDVCKEYL